MLTTILCAALLGSPVVGVDADLLDLAPIRQRRNLTVGGELGYNGLGGLGLHIGYDVHPHFSIDGALGMSLIGPKVGLGGRFNLLRSRLTPFVAAGATFATGTTGSGVVEMSRQGKTARVSVTATPAVQATAGLSYVAEHGFTMLASLGYSQVLVDNHTSITGNLTAQEVRQINMFTGSGPVASLMLGYAF